MSFSASTCITIPAGVTTSGFFNIYSNVDNYINPFQTNVSYYELAGVTTPQGVVYSCPYIIGNVPNGTTIIKIIDTTTKCCVTIDLLSNDLCTTCDLSFDSYQSNIIGRIVAGELTGSCENEITDYKIFWYGPDSTTNVAFTSGFGTEFTPYDLTHPLIGNNSPTALAGEYIPVIDKIKLNGLDFSQTGETSYIQAELECFNATTVNVSPFTCDNGTEVGDYTHRVNFSGASAGVTPLTLQSTFELDPTTNYFAWKFKGFSVPDSLKITFFGSSYDNPIILEYWTIGGQNITSNIGISTIPKSGQTSTYFSKVTSLTTLTINPGDYIKLEVIPNPNNPTTNWDFYFTCLDTFDCSLCLDNYLNSPYKIKTSTIANTSEGNCGQRRIKFSVSGCSINQNFSSDIGKYMLSQLNIAANSFSNVSTDNTTFLLESQTIVSTGTTSCSWNGSGSGPECASSSNNTIKFEKTTDSGIGKINMVFSSLNDLILYKNSYESKKLSSGWVNNPNNINYYKYAKLAVPNSTGNDLCGDPTVPLIFSIHFSSVIITGQTSTEYTLTMTMPIITNELSFGTCEQGCTSSVNSVVNEINNSSTATSNNIIKITNTSSKYTDPFFQYWFVNYSVNAPTNSGTFLGLYRMYNTFDSTIPFSGSSSPYTLIPPLSSQTCDFTSKGTTFNSGTALQYQDVFVFDYRLDITSPPNLTSYTINANPIVNGVRTSTTYPDTAVTVVNGTVTYSNPLYTF
jgi:hypothetical protein